MKRIVLTVLSILTVCLIAIGLTACGDSPVTFKLNFVVDNEIIKTIDTNGNENIALPTNPVKDGYTFDGWYWDNGTWQRPFTANSLLNEPLISDMSVYAKFTENHQHTYSTEWTTDDTYHWHNATCEHTNEIKDKATHTASEWITDENATYESTGSKHKECTVCKKVLETAEIPQLIKDEITFNTLSVDDNLNVYGKVPNNQTVFSFINEVKVSGNATFVVSTDIYGIQQVPTKTVPLNAGDNTFYITETVGNDIRLFTVTVRRKPMYIVSFNTNGGTTVENQTVQEDSFAIESTTTRTGYTFVSWDYDFNLPITETKTITASWQVNSFPLTINYYYKDTTNKIADTYTSQVDFDSSYNVVSPLITGYTADNLTISGTMDSVNRKTINVYYTANKYTLTINYYYKDTTNKVFDSYTSQVAYDSEYSVDSPLKAGYSIDIAKVIGTMDNVNGKTINVYYTPNANTPYKVEYYLQNLEDDNFTIDNTLTENLSGTTDTTANITPKDVEHFTFTENNSKLCGNINSDGSLILKVYYTRNKYTLSNVNIDYGSITNSGTYKYGAEQKQTDATECLGCEFVGWFNGEKLLSTDKTYAFTVEKDVAAKFKIKDEMSNFNFTSTFTSCEITSVKDKTITNIVVPDYVTSIKQQAFCACSLLESAIIGNGVTWIDYCVFQSCSSLTSVTIGNNVRGIGSGIFQGCSSLESIEIPNSVNSIGNLAFYGCSSLTSVTIGNSVTSIGYEAFKACSSLTSVTIENSVTYIGSYAFSNCSKLTKVNYTGDINSWVQISFVDSIANPLYYAENLYINDVLVTNAEITTATKINSYAFYNCSSLTSVSIPNSVTSIGSYAFSGCSSLTSVTIGNNVWGIGSGIFYGCSSLTSIVIPDSVTSIDSYAFGGCSSLTKVYYKGTTSEWDNILIYSSNSSLKNATRYYYSETQPTTEGNYWHYDIDGTTILEW